MISNISLTVKKYIIFYFVLAVTMCGCINVATSKRPTPAGGTPDVITSNGENSNAAPDPTEIQSEITPISTSIINKATPTGETSSSTKYVEPIQYLARLAPGFYPVFWDNETKNLLVGFLDGTEPVSLGILPGWKFPDSITDLFADHKKLLTVVEDEILRFDYFVIYDIPGGVKTTLLPGFDASQSGSQVTDVWYPAVSPDGQWVSYVAKLFENGKPVSRGYDLFITSLKTGLTHRLIDGDGNCIGTHWSPDGKWLAFTADYLHANRSVFLNETTADIFLLDTQCFSSPETCKKTMQRIVPWSGNSRPYFYWAMDSRSILYECEKVMCQVNLTGKDIGKVPDIRGVSPDHKWQAYVQKNSLDNENLVLLNILTEERTLLLREKEFIGVQQWSPDSQYLALEVNEGELVLRQDGQIVKFNNFSGNDKRFVFWWTVPGTIQADSWQTITTLGDELNLRSEPGQNKPVVHQFQSGEKIYIISGPVWNEPYYWWRVRTAGGEEGWVAEVAGWFKSLETPVDSTITPAP